MMSERLAQRAGFEAVQHLKLGLKLQQTGTWFLHTYTDGKDVIEQMSDRTRTT